MAIAPTGDIFKSLEFDGESSKNYGVYITGAAVYNAPEREVEMISIPGRNGAFALDKGRFENIEVTYPAGIFADNDLDFARAVSDFRNFLCSKNGYCKLTDDYNPDEYRMAIYKSGLEVEPAQLKAGEFELVFDCKPQRYMMGGETPIEVSNGDTILNPTLFEASPLLMVEGYGNINVNGYDIDIANDGIGDTVVGIAEENTNGNPIVQTIDDNLFVSGDKLTIQPFHPQVVYKKGSGVTSVSLGTRTNCTASLSGDYIAVTMYPEAYEFYSLGDTAFYMTGGVAVTYTKNSAQYAETLDVTVYVEYNKANSTITYTGIITAKEGWTGRPKKMASGEVIADSTVSILGHPTYIDCDIGEAYKYEDNSIVPLNRHIDLGSKLPVLSVGTNYITFDNTFTDVSIVPRWWKI